MSWGLNNVTLDWTFSFLRFQADGIPEQQFTPKIIQIMAYRDGKLQMHATPAHMDLLSQMQPLMMLLSYIAYFPDRDFVKIKLRTATNQYAFHFLDKRYLDQHKLGVLSVSEFDINTAFEHWGYEETMAEYIFEYFWDSEKSQPTELADFKEWINDQVADFYLDWLEAKNNSAAKSLREITTSEKILSEMEQTWDIQLINEYGAPITEVLSFIDSEAFVYEDEQEMLHQNLASMSLTALKILIDQQGGWNIDYLKGKLGNEMGFQYTLFKKFSIKDVRYLLIMNTSIYDPDKNECLQIFRGNEYPLLEAVAGRIKLHSDLFTMNGQLGKREDQAKVQNIVIDCVKEVFR
jgi:hypothetical protein